MLYNHFLKLANTENSQTEFGDEVELIKEFIEYFYYQREHVKDSHERMVIIVKYGNDFIKLQKDYDKFMQWYKNTKC